MSANGIVRLTERELADRKRFVNHNVLQNLLDDECEIDTELIQMEARTPTYSPYRFPEREKLQRRRGRISEERRRFLISSGEKLDALNSRLLSLVSKHRLLDLVRDGSNYRERSRD